MVEYLSGEDKDRTVLWDFFCSKGRSSGRWSKIPVPSCWETQGFGTYNYGWEENYKENETGIYKTQFQYKPEWKGKRIRIVFEGSMTDTHVKINGKPAGPVHRGSFYRFKYDITSLIQKVNTLEVVVDKISADTSVNRAERMSDYWVFGGIYRPVYLEILPKEFIDWTAIDARADGSFQIHVYTSTLARATSIEARLFDSKDQEIGQPFSAVIDRKNNKTILRTVAKQISVWNPENPHLYKVRISLKAGDNIIHTVTEKFGFRTIEFKKDDGFYLNNTKIMFKGVNRHTFWPTKGRTTSKELSIMDVNLIKDMNMNAVRMSHYPPDGHFLDVCDSLGLLVLDELGGWQKSYDTPVGEKLVAEMIMKDVNHPSIVIWDNGNEGGNNHALVSKYAEYDPQKRKVIHPWNVFEGTDTQHYKGYDCCTGSLYKGNNVFFPTEILHGLYDGGNGAGLNDHWRSMESNPLSAGCFLWSFCDEGLVRPDLDSVVDVKGDRAPDGIVGPFREKEGSFYTIKEIWSPIQIVPKAIFDGSFTVQNKFYFTNLRDVTFTWQYKKFSLPGGRGDFEILSQGSIKGPDIKSQASGDLDLGMIKNPEGSDVFYLTASDKYGREIFTWSYPLTLPGQYAERYLAAKAEGAPSFKVIETDSLLTVNGSILSFTFSKETGALVLVRNKGVDISVSNGPRLVSGTAAVDAVKHYADENKYVVDVRSVGDLKNLRYTIQANGILKIAYTYSHYNWKEKNEFEFLGVTFNYPEEKIRGVTFLGYGPYRVWKNRMRGGQFGIWDKKYNNTVTGESWDYPEFKGYYKNFYSATVDNTELPFTVFTADPNIFLRLYTPEKPAGAHNDFNSPSFPSGDISFLNAINPIGTKFDAATNHGSEGAPNKIGWVPISGTLYFDFDIPSQNTGVDIK